MNEKFPLNHQGSAFNELHVAVTSILQFGDLVVSHYAMVKRN
jgi:hypothetical protein